MDPNKSDKTVISSLERAPRVIKRYSNRKLYDTVDSRYVTLLQIAQLVRSGEDVQIIDNASKEDKTEVTLALIISEELKAQPRAVPLRTLRELIQERGGKMEPRSEDTGKHRPDDKSAGAEASEHLELRAEIMSLSERVAALEARLERLDHKDEQPR
jgi:polyhydroxyalkanoate synthesis repressor PhaR